MGQKVKILQDQNFSASKYVLKVAHGTHNYFFLISCFLLDQPVMLEYEVELWPPGVRHKTPFVLGTQIQWASCPVCLPACTLIAAKCPTAEQHFSLAEIL